MRGLPYRPEGRLVVIAVALLVAGCGGSDAGGKSGLLSRWGSPTGAFAGERPRALVILIHGGGWRGPDRPAFEATAAMAPIFQQRGFATLTVDYRSGAAGFADVDRFYRTARKRVGSQLPICAYGASAGGTVALMLAARHPDLDCVVSLAGPTDLPALAHEPGGAVGYRLALRAFGRAGLSTYSPIRHAKDIKARVLLVAATNDPFVPLAQTTEMARADPNAQTIVLPAGDLGGPFVHSHVDRAAAQRAARTELAFLAAGRSRDAR